MPSFKPFAAAANTLRGRLSPSLRTRGGGGGGPSRWTSPGHEDRPKGFALNRTPLPPGESRKWEDWELPCYITSFLAIVILGVGLNAKPDLTIETWAHQKALERLELEASQSVESD
ncbi:NADH:ubiquinone reductase (H(+)-translocating) [Handroanthus impetiginosus]|uniref:NADH:ubiquinone reductase (H(+)-translocating) n=1 Tax=Handroanthus impetiginosus TaxID=429701 RepID=A0A2G9GFF2_9LAMI|nr:NADH:ubiquinone reductase (H(+)-translocating) [Handroanthus impetiginosus]